MGWDGVTVGYKSDYAEVASLGDRKIILVSGDKGVRGEGNNQFGFGMIKFEMMAAHEGALKFPHEAL